MAEAILAIVAPMVIFGAVALASLKWGAESRPGFDERLVLDDRPNWPAIPRRPPAEPTIRPSAPPPIVTPRPARAARSVSAPRPSTAAAATANGS